MSELPPPLVMPEVDLRDFQFMPLDITRLFSSEFHALSNDTAWRAGVTLWLKSWHQVPAASLPTDDVSLARLAEFGRDVKGWLKIKEAALRGWQLCNDGRLYHSVVAEKATEAWERKCAQRDRTEKARLARLSQRLSQTTEAAVTDHVTLSVTASKGQGQGQGSKKKEPSAPKKIASRIPENWRPSNEETAYAEKTGLSLTEIERETEKFRNYWAAKAGKDAAKLDWEATWRNWVMTAAERLGRQPKLALNGHTNGAKVYRNEFGDPVNWRKRIEDAKTQGFWPRERWGPIKEIPAEFSEFVAGMTEQHEQA